MCRTQHQKRQSFLVYPSILKESDGSQSSDFALWVLLIIWVFTDHVFAPIGVVIDVEVFRLLPGVLIICFIH